MNYLDFLRDSLVSSQALGVGPGSAAEAIEAAWGPTPLEDAHKRGKVKRWDYGLMEFSLKRESEWICTGFMIQVHRLAQHGNSIVPRAASSAYGEFPKSVAIGSVSESLKKIGTQLVEERAPGSGYRIYVIPATHNVIHVFQDDSSEPYQGHRPGDVWSISVQG